MNVQRLIEGTVKCCTDNNTVIWGGFSVDNATLNRFFSLHYLLPFILAALAAMHLLTLHEHGSSHPDNYIPANPMQTPASIVPEWYLLPFYAILRSIPDKLGGVIAMFGSLLILLAMPLLDTSRVRGSAFRPLMKLAFWLLVVDFLILLWCGGQHVEEPFISLGQAATVFYFSWFLIILPVVGIVENTLMDLAAEEKKQ
ncbi:hypothetical protein INT48_007961 [Thamnidium elegans]|uniref:Cytochrome b n=1 Tax=Thamnidium elegans TaxID=101142 RepID=A0A8H7SMZ2_9FUNG|nr:hypothetical protein INT48_007961 [Thamnidium elegans]